MATAPHVDGLRRPSLETDYSRQSVVDVVRLARLAKRAFTVDGKSPYAEPAPPPPVIDPAVLLQMRRNALSKSKKELRFFTSRAASDVCKDLEVDPNVGLTTAEAAARLKDHGRNELQKEEKEGILRMIFDQFTDLLVIMLIVSAMVSLLLGEREAAIAIVVIVLANAVLGVVQESKAEAALEALETLSSPTTTVLRDAIHQEIESALVVPGDIIILDLGKSITADVRLIDTQAFYCGEMALTGESEPVKKDASFLYPPVDPNNPETPRGARTPRGGKKEETLTEKNMAYMGCTVLDGRGKGVAVKTGMATKMGEIAHLLKGADKGMSPLQAKLSALGEKLGMASLAISAVVFVVGVITGHGADPASVQPVWLQMLLVAVSLTVAAVPEGLPACVTITLAIGMRQMVKKNALIRNLRSVETLGSASVICTDKTGTLTTGVMTAVRIWFSGVVFKITGQSYEPVGEITPLDSGVTPHPSNAHLRPLFHGMLCSNARLQRNVETKAWECVGNSSERPLVVAAAKAGVNGSEVESTFLRLHENPFSSQRKSMSVVHLLPANASPSLLTQLLGEESARSISASAVDRFLVIAKGAPLSVVEMSTHTLAEDGSVVPMTPAARASIEAAIDDFSNQAFRVLAIAYRVADELPEDRSHESLEHDMVFAGLVGSIDPEREEVAPSIKKAAAAGIRTVMITGDYVKTAKAIAEKIGILPAGSPDAKAVDCEIVRELGGELEAIHGRLTDKDSKLSPEEKKQLKTLEDEVHAKLDGITSFADVYARAKPADKITIVRSLQRQGHICSMTGDGVNDAPALKQANIGVAMGITGTDVAKAASDMVLTDDNFCSIVEAIEQGRNIYANIQKFVFFLLSTNVSEVFVIFIPVLLGMPAPMVPIQLLWMNLATDGMPAIALAMEACEPGLMDEGPRPASESIIEKVMIVGIVIQTIVLTGLGIWLYMLGLKWNVGSWNADHIVVENGRMSELFFAKGVAKARTMVIMFYCFAELWRAYSSRSMRVSVFDMGFWKNKVMQRAVGASVAGTIIMATVPRAMSIFDTEYLSFREYFVVTIISIVPFAVDEATKAVYRATGFGRRPTVFERAAQPVETVIGKEEVNEEGEVVDPNAPSDAESKKTN